MHSIKLYNTLTRKKETFKPIKKGDVSIYTCGPTVYWFAHVGNFRAYIFSDILKRVLQYNKLKVNHIINVTDVGHLTSDSDEGEDKLEKASKREKKSAKELSNFYLKEFLKDFKKLNLISPKRFPKATEHIKEQISMIKTIEEKGCTYKTTDGIYFDTSKFKDYGKLSRKNIKGLEAGKRVSLKEKKNITDFALWKFSKPSDKRQQEWKSPWGVGFPGWHIECSAMSSKYLGENFDIHTGGIDHVPVHHENEIAQSEIAFGKKPWVNYWMHGEFLEIKGGKMSKSKGKTKTISQLEKEGIDPLAYKYFTYTANYRKPLTWSEESLNSSINSFKRLKNLTTKLKKEGTENRRYLKEFEKRINDDLDVPGALAVLWKLLRDENAKGKFETIKKMDEVFGLKLLEKNKLKIPKEIIILAEDRKRLRKNKDWKGSDRLRIQLEKEGWKIRDENEGYVLDKL